MFIKQTYSSKVKNFMRSINDFLSELKNSDNTISNTMRFTPNFVKDNATSEAIALSELPNAVRSKLDYLAARVLDEDNNTTILTGAPFSGKTFLLEQFVYNIDEYTSKTNSNTVHFIKLTDVDVIELSNVDVFKEMFTALTKNLSTHENNICFVTESAEVALYVSTVLPKAKIILEINIDNFMSIARNSQKANSKVWRNWQIVDADELYCTQNELIDLLEVSVLAKTNKSLKNPVSKRQLKSFVTYAINRMENIEQELDGKMVIAVPPGIWATVFRHVMTDYAYTTDPAFLHKNGNVNFNKVMKRSFSDTSELFANFDPNNDEDNEITGIEDIMRIISEGGGRVIDLSNLPPGMANPFSGMMANGMEEIQKKEVTPIKFKDVENLDKRLHGDIIGQDEAISKVCDGIVVTAAGLHDPKRPLRSFLFLGPTGVGKTQLALELAKEVSTEELNVVRIDMSEYQQEHEVAKLFGAPPGYVGFDQGGALTNAVLEHPHSLVLLDEIEKAHPKVWDSFLQVLDNGHMTDSKGQSVDFTQTIVVMTSNIGAGEAAKRRSGFGVGQNDSMNANKKESQAIIMNSLEHLFRREMINRIDEIIIFNSISDEMAHKIIDREFLIVSRRLAERGYTINGFDESVIDLIIKKSDIKTYGAREIQRVILRNISNPIAHHIVKNSGSHELTLSVVDNEINITSTK